MDMHTHMSIHIQGDIPMNDHTDFLALLQSVDAFFPIGAFTLSNGLEDYVVRERIGSAKELASYLRGFLQIFPYGDLGVLSLAYQSAGNPQELLRLDGLAHAMKGAKEVRIGSSRMCSRYLKAREAMKDMPEGLRWYQEQIREKRAAGVHPVALGIYGAEHKVEEERLLMMYGYSILSAIVNNAVKLVPLGQLDGQRVLYEAFPLLAQAVKKSMEISQDDLGVSGTSYEIHCMNHEILYSRQYMS